MIQHNSKNHDIMERLYSPDKMVGNFYQYFVTRKQWRLQSHSSFNGCSYAAVTLCALL